MSRRSSEEVPWSFWLVGIFSLIWNAMGCMNYVWQMNLSSDVLATLSEAQRALIENRPAWLTAAFAISVFAGTIGSVFLLFKRSFSIYFFVLSLIGIVGSMIPVFGKFSSGVSFSGFEIVMYVVGTPLLGVFLVWYASYAKKRRWLR